MQLRDLKNGDVFKRKADSKSVLVKGHYNHCDKTFTCHHFDDINREVFIKASKEVFTEFEF